MLISVGLSVVFLRGACVSITGENKETHAAAPMMSSQVPLYSDLGGSTKSERGASDILLIS